MSKPMSPSKRIRLLYSQVDPKNPKQQGKIASCDINSRWDIKDPKVTKSGYYEIKAADGTIRIAFDVWVD